MQEKTLDFASRAAQKILKEYVQSGDAPLQEFKYPFRMSDTGNAEMATEALRGRFLYIIERNAWFIFDGRRWTEDKGNLIRNAFTDAVLENHRMALSISDSDTRIKVVKWLTQCENSARITNAIMELQHQSGMFAYLKEFDNDPFILNCENGTLNLITNELHPHHSTDKLMRLANVEYEPGAVCPQFVSFIQEIMCGDAEKIRYLQKCLGYGLTGKTSEQTLFTWRGSGANGKSSLQQIMVALAGDYVAISSPDLILEKNIGQISNDLARLQGIRMVFMSEPEPTKRISVSAVKVMTGEDKVIARFLYGEFFEYDPKLKLFISTNHMLKVLATDYAFWRRQSILPFDFIVPPTKIDYGLVAKLLHERSGILNWLLAGLQLWMEEGLKKPEAVEQSTENYKNSMDAIGIFIDECCELVRSATCKKGELYKAYTTWCIESGEHSISQKDLSVRMSERGFKSGRDRNGDRAWLDIGVLSTDTQDTFDPGPF